MHVVLMHVYRNSKNNDTVLLYIEMDLILSSIMFSKYENCFKEIKFLNFYELKNQALKSRMESFL